MDAKQFTDFEFFERYSNFRTAVETVCPFADYEVKPDTSIVQININTEAELDWLYVKNELLYMIENMKRYDYYCQSNYAIVINYIGDISDDSFWYFSLNDMLNELVNNNGNAVSVIVDINELDEASIGNLKSLSITSDVEPHRCFGIAY